MTQAQMTVAVVAARLAAGVLSPLTPPAFATGSPFSRIYFVQLYRYHLRLATRPTDTVRLHHVI